jgi:glutamine synthetase
MDLMIRGYDTNALWRHDEILRIRHLEAEIAASQEEIDIQKQKAVAAVERFQRTKKWLDIID